MKKFVLLTLPFLLLTHSNLMAQDARKNGEWKSLFDGKSLKGWVDGKGKAPGKGWVVKDGVLHRGERSGDIFSEKEFYNFELEFEWKVAKGSNSGLKYRFARYNGSNIGCEYQVLDDANHSNGKNPKQTAGSLYDVIAPNEVEKKLKAVGEWNTSRVVAKGAKVEHWLNGKKILEVDMESEAWAKALEKSKFRGSPTFGLKSGTIMLQDHGDPVWFRNVRIKEFE